MKKIIDIHTNVLLGEPNKENPRVQELFKRIRSNSAKQINLIKKKTINVNKKANLFSLRASMKQNNISNAICFSYQWKKHSDCLKANNYLIENLNKDIFSNLYCLVVVQPKSKNAKDDLTNYLNNKKVLGLKIKPSWCGISLSNIKYLGPICEELIFRKKILLTHITQSFHPNKGDNIYELSLLLKNFPKLKVVAAHMGGGISFYENYQPLQKIFKNLYIDISLPSQIDWLPSFLEKLNYKKFLFASDFPYYSQKDLLFKIKKLRIPKNKINDLLFNNGKNLINSCSKINIL